MLGLAVKEWLSPPSIWYDLRPLAREHRSTPTAAENRLWQALRRKQIGGHHFRRQHVIGSFIVDFYCSEARLIIEIDGSIHDSPEAKQHDADRQKTLEEVGFNVLRFTNEQTLEDRDSVVATIQSWFHA